MKKVRIISIIILIIILLIAGANIVIAPLSDWIVRINHIVMLSATIAVTFCTVRIKKESR